MTATAQDPRQLWRNADGFTRAYVTTALWSSNDYAYGECPSCGETRVLDRYPEKEFKEEAMCGGPCCGVREISNPESLDQNYNQEDIAPETLAGMVADCEKFQAEAGGLIREAIATGEVKHGPDFDEWERAGHDFWLTRCGHGAGFFDGDWPEPFAAKLTAMAKAFGNVDLYVGDDGKIYA